MCPYLTAHFHSSTHTHTHTHTYTHAHTHTTYTRVVQDPSVTAATLAQPGAGQDDYNPFADEGVTEKEPEVNDNIVICTFSMIMHIKLRRSSHFRDNFVHFSEHAWCPEISSFYSV